MANQVMYGFVSLQNVFSRRVLDVGVNEVFTAIAETVDEHNRTLQLFMGALLQRTTDFQTRFRTMGTARLQPIDENSLALPIQTGAFYTVGFPIQRGGVAWGQGYEAGVKMTVEQANENTRLMIDADSNWMRDQILGALFNNVSYTFTDEQYGDVTVRPLANGDTQTYNVVGNPLAPVTAQHFLAQANAIADGADNPFDDIYDLLSQYPGNTRNIWVLVPSNLLASIRALGSFLPVADPNVRVGANSNVLVGAPDIALPGITRGYVEEKVFIREWKGMPSNYMIAMAEGSPPPLAMREDESPELQGFHLESDETRFPWRELQYRRKVGFGALNRTAAAVIRIGNGTYAPPTGYSLPMP
jgi:hypothetical protein